MQKTLQDIKKKIASAQGMDATVRQELTALVDKLYTELETLAKTDRDRAENVSGLTRTTVAEVTDGNRGPDFDHASNGLSDAVEQLEVTHPRLADAINRICKMLADIGI